MDFSQAYARLKEIHHRMTSWGAIIEIDEVVSLQKEAKECYDVCKKKILKAEDALEEFDGKNEQLD